MLLRPMQVGGIGLVLALFILALPAQAQIISIKGPGIVPEVPVRLFVNPPDGVVEAEYEYTSLTATVAAIRPQLTCPPQTLNTEIEDAPFVLLPGESRRVKARFNDLPGGVGAGTTVQCRINGAAEDTIVFVAIMPAPPAARTIQVVSAMSISITPDSQTPSHKVSGVLVGISNNLTFSFLSSGLTITSSTALSMAGIDSTTLSLVGTLGGLNFSGSLNFAVPRDSSDIALGPLTFVSKQITATLTFSGLTISNTFLLQDIAFPHAPSVPMQLQITDTLAFSGVTAQGLFISAAMTFRIPPGGNFQIVSEVLTLANLKFAGVTNFVSATLSFAGTSVGLTNLIVSSTATLAPYDLKINNFLVFGRDLLLLLDVLSTTLKVGDFSSTITFLILPSVTGTFNFFTVTVQNSLTFDTVNLISNITLCVEELFCSVAFLQHTLLLSVTLDNLTLSSSTVFNGLFDNFAQEVLAFSLALDGVIFSSTSTIGANQLISQVFTLSWQF